MIIVYSSLKCGACKLVKDYLIREGLIENEDFIYVVVNGNREASRYVRENYAGVPVIEYKDKAFIGFEVEELNQIIDEVKSKK